MSGTITAPPGYSLRVRPHMVDLSTRGRQCVEHGPTSKCPGTCPDPNLLTIDSVPNDPALSAVLAYIVDQAHEAIEWIAVDGRRFADPHPEGEAGFDLLCERITAVLVEYRDAFPAPEVGP